MVIFILYTGDPEKDFFEAQLVLLLYVVISNKNSLQFLMLYKMIAMGEVPFIV